MKRALNTLFVTTQGAYLSRDGETVKVRVNDEVKMRVPIHTLGGIICFGNVLCSPPLMALCAEHDVLLSFLSEQGRYLARLQGPTSGNVLLRREQFRRADDEGSSSGIARAVVVGKIVNCRTVLMRAAREHGDAELTAAASQLGDYLAELREPVGLKRARGLEGIAANVYFGVFRRLIRQDCFKFSGRSRRPPCDPVNSLLSYLYAILAHDVTAACEAVGLDPQVGFLHRDRPGRPSLALDLMEELRPVIADRLALSLINRGQIRPAGFRTTESGAVVMKDKTRKTVLVALQTRKQDEITHPFLGEKVTLGIVPHLQALLLARHFRDDIDGYPPFLWR